MKMKSLLRNLIIPVCLMGILILSAGTASADWTEDWSGDLFAGMNQSSGNTDKGSASVTGSASKEIGKGEFTLSGKLFYSQSNNKMDGQKWEALTKYTLDFGDEDVWFSTYQVMADHDRFADVDYRITPSAGLGYHLAREEDWTWDVDASLGYEITRYRINSANDDETMVAIFHTFAKKKILENAFISEDLSVIPGLESGAGYRVKSESTFSNPLQDNLDLEIKYLVDYDSEPAVGKSSTDKQLVAGVKYKF